MEGQKVTSPRESEAVKGGSSVRFCSQVHRPRPKLDSFCSLQLWFCSHILADMLIWNTVIYINITFASTEPELARRLNLPFLLEATPFLLSGHLRASTYFTISHTLKKMVTHILESAISSKSFSYALMSKALGFGKFTFTQIRTFLHIFKRDHIIEFSVFNFWGA